MIEVHMQVVAERGLYLRVLTDMVRQAMRFGSRITLAASGATADGKSVMSVLSLGIEPGDRVVLAADGPDEVAAVSELVRTLRRENEAWIQVSGKGEE